MHHDLSRSLDLLQTIKRHVVKVAGAIQVPLLISHYLLEEMVTPCLSLLLLEQEVVGGCDLIVLIILNVSYGLAKVTIGTDSRRRETVLDFAEVLVEHGDPILPDHYSLHLCRLYLLVPFVCPDVLHSVPLVRISVQNLPYQILARLRNETGDEVIAIQNLLVKFTGIRIFKWQIATGHSIENNAGAPDIGIEAVVALASNHLWSGVTRTATRRFEHLSFLVHV